MWKTLRRIRNIVSLFRKRIRTLAGAPEARPARLPDGGRSRADIYERVTLRRPKRLPRQLRLSDAGEKVGTSPHRQDARGRRDCLTNLCCHMTGTIAKPMGSQPTIHGLIAEVHMDGLK
jgi:hypothetical protein